MKILNYAPLSRNTANNKNMYPVERKRNPFIENRASRERESAIKQSHIAAELNDVAIQTEQYQVNFDAAMALKKEVDLIKASIAELASILSLKEDELSRQNQMNRNHDENIFNTNCMWISRKRTQDRFKSIHA